MKTRLQEYFGENIIITNVQGKPNVVTLRRTAASVLAELHKDHQRHADPEQKKLDVIRAAAKPIRNDIQLVQTPVDKYPITETEPDKHVEFLPLTLRILLEEIFSGKKMAVKIASIGQAIMQTTRPRAVLAPLQIGLGIQLHHVYSSRFLIDTLHQLVC